MDTATKHYADRDAMALEKAGGYYTRHVSAMTTEQLHSKSDIAAELGWRDMEIDRLRAVIQAQSVPADCDVRKIMLAVVPGEDGMGTEVYAKNTGEVEAKLSEMGGRLEDWELGIRRLAAAPQPQPVQAKCTSCGWSVSQPTIQHLPSEDTEGGAT